MEPGTLRAAVYTRISRDAEGRKNGVKRQERACLEHAASMGLEVAEVFSDNDKSASTRARKKRPDYEAMLARARNGEFEYVIAYSSSRLTRKVREFVDLIDLYNEHGVQYVMVNTERGQYDLGTAQGRGDALRAAVQDQQEAEILAERVQLAAQDRRRRGEFHGGPVPYGYRGVVTEFYEPDPDEDPLDWDEGEVPLIERKRTVLIPDEHESALLREAVDRLFAGETAYKIVKDWNDRGERTRPTKKFPEGTLWRHSNFRPLLTNRTLLGENGGIADDGTPLRPWTPILDDETSERLVAHFKKRANGVTNPFGPASGKYALTGGMSVCGTCKAPLVAATKVYRDGSKEVRLACRPMAHDPEALKAMHPLDEKGHSTGRVTIRNDELESYVFESFAESMRASKVWEKAKTQTSPKVIAHLNDLESERARLSEKRARVVEMREDGDISREDFKVKIAPIDARLSAISAEMDRLTGAEKANDLPTSEHDLETRLASFSTWTAKRQRDFLHLLIGRVEVRPQDSKTRIKKRKTESDAVFAARRRDAVIERTTIVPVWEL